MPAIYWGPDRIAEKDFNRLVQVGDVLQLIVDGETADYTVDKIFYYYPDKGTPEQRISVTNDAPIPFVM